MSDTKPTLMVPGYNEYGHFDRPATLPEIVGGLLEHIKCDRCEGSGHLYVDPDEPCPDCVGGYRVSGLVAAARESGHGWTTDMRDLSRFIVAWLEEMRADK